MPAEMAAEANAINMPTEKPTRTAVANAINIPTMPTIPEMAAVVNAINMSTVTLTEVEFLD